MNTETGQGRWDVFEGASKKKPEVEKVLEVLERKMMKWDADNDEIVTPRSPLSRSEDFGKFDYESERVGRNRWTKSVGVDRSGIV